MQSCFFGILLASRLLMPATVSVARRPLAAQVLDVATLLLRSPAELLARTPEVIKVELPTELIRAVDEERPLRVR
jgi:hypothetical protein